MNRCDALEKATGISQKCDRIDENKEKQALPPASLVSFVSWLKQLTRKPDAKAGARDGNC